MTMQKIILAISLITISIGLSSCGDNVAAKAKLDACDVFMNDVYGGIQNGESDAVLAATSLYVYDQAQKSKNKELIEASSALYDGFNLSDISLAGKAVVDLKRLCAKE
ncbi:hypothetical protein MCEMRE182_00241 [Candidatus Nanopelagicaceae bacterium]